jgi:hypothetical protein
MGCLRTKFTGYKGNLFIIATIYIEINDGMALTLKWTSYT